MASADPVDRDAAFALVERGLSVLAASGFEVGDVTEAYGLVRRLERVQRVAGAVGLDAVASLERAGWHRVDGHANGRVLVGFLANLSGADAKRRARGWGALRDLPVVAAGVRRGEIGTSQLEAIGRVLGNRRVRDALVELDEMVAIAATRLPYDEFASKLADWVRLADEDGAADRAERNHANRDFCVHRNLDGSRRFTGGVGSLQGQVLADVHAAYVQAEWEADWAEARARLGDAATFSDLCRTDPQRRADALAAIFRDAAAARADTPGGHAITTDVVLDQVTFERTLARLAGDDPGPDPRLADWFTPHPGDPRTHDDLHLHDHPLPDHEPLPEDQPAQSEPLAAPGSPPPAGLGLVGFRSSSIDGTPIDVTEATAAALIGHVRRVVVGTDSVVVDMGRRARLFTGPRHSAVTLATTHCYWPGCSIPASLCQADHLIAFNSPERGPTTPTNGAPACAKHNRFRNHGYTVQRALDGTLTVHRPDGTPIR